MTNFQYFLSTDRQTLTLMKIHSVSNGSWAVKLEKLNLRSNRITLGSVPSSWVTTLVAHIMILAQFPQQYRPGLWTCLTLDRRRKKFCPCKMASLVEALAQSSAMFVLMKCNSSFVCSGRVFPEVSQHVRGGVHLRRLVHNGVSAPICQRQK